MLGVKPSLALLAPAHALEDRHDAGPERAVVQHEAQRSLQALTLVARRVLVLALQVVEQNGFVSELLVVSVLLERFLPNRHADHSAPEVLALRERGSTQLGG